MFYKVMIAHYIADFILQTRWMGENKSKKLLALISHIGVYTAVLVLLFGLKFGLINGIIHFVVDFFTSKASSYAYKKQNMEMFWAIIGLDQLIHVLTLFATLTLI